jgi:glycosyltransferase involved in cell wall biosynthesis
MEISIIIPVYNVEKYLVKCLDSIFHQQFSGNFEVIAVDDASVDNSLQLLYDYQKGESRLKIIAHDVNKKQPIARSTGMEASIGDYIMHVDADDWILPNTLEKLYAKCKETDADVVVFNYARENSKGERILNRKIKKVIITKDKLKVQQYFLGTSVNKIVKRALISDMISGKIGVNTSEDLLYATEILLRAEKICLIPECYYVYFVNMESITQTVKSELFLQNQIIILSQLQAILSVGNINPKFISYILNYFEKRIYFVFAESQLLRKGVNNSNIKLIQEFTNYPILSQARIKRLELSNKNSLICFLEVIFRSGLRMSLGIIKSYLKNRK